MKYRLLTWAVVCILAGVTFGCLSIDLVPSQALRIAIGLLGGIGCALVPIPSAVNVSELGRPIAALSATCFSLAILIFDIAADRTGLHTFAIASIVGLGIYWATTREM